MHAIWRTFTGIITLQTETFARFRDDPRGLRWGLTWLVGITLLAGSLAFAQDVWHGLRSPKVEIGNAQRRMEEGFRQLQRSLPPGIIPPELIDQIEEDFKVGMQIGAEIMALPTVLPRPLGAFFRSLGDWWSEPFRHMAGWLSYALWVMLAAKLLGGRGGLRSFLATTSLYAVPQILTILQIVPVLGTILGWIAAIWGWVIYTKATAVAHSWVETVTTASGEAREQTDWGRALAAVLLPAIVLVAFIALVMISLLILVLILRG